jgi:hypothetical protein
VQVTGDGTAVEPAQPYAGARNHSEEEINMPTAKNLMFLTLLVTIPQMAQADPITKYEKRTPEALYNSTANIYDIERCLIHSEGNGGYPIVYSQPDRPGHRVIIWINDNNDSSARVDLQSEGSLTRVKTWNAIEKNKVKFEACAPHQ